MRGLTAAELLAAWEQGIGHPPFRRALILLAAAQPDCSIEQLARLSIGQRDARLLALREQTFGSRLVSVATCEACGEQLELTFDADEIRAAPVDQLTLRSPADEAAEPQCLSLNLNGYDISFRLPASIDLEAIAEVGEPAASPRVLLQRCIQSATFDGTAVSVSDLPADLLAVVAARMEEADPQANVQLNLTCAPCGKPWQAVFDIEAFLWAEITRWAERLLLDVHQLARAYGWREADILAMSPHRRRFYLDLLSR
ncbi:MAG: phage baseplate protein [Blastocatellia bacterium]